MDFTMKLPQLPSGTKPFCLGAFVGAVLLGYVGFNVMGWTLGGTVIKIAQRQADTAVATALAPVCAAQFRSAPDAEARLAALGKTDRWARGEELAKGGFTTLPGSKEANANIATACAELLIPEKS